MDNISFKLDVFEGPLDLLLHLISKHKLNINDIEISKLLEQYLLYIEQAKEQDLELAGEFLEMAARLIYIKTVSLLPKPEEAEEIKKELQGTLIEYSLCKKAAAKLREKYAGNDIFVREPIKIKLDSVYKLSHPPQKLAEAYMNMNIKKTDFKQANEKKINEKDTPVVFILWGNFAKSKKNLITNPKHLIIESSHPSPFSCNYGFFGSRPFSRTNKFLRENNIKEIDFKVK